MGARAWFFDQIAASITTELLENPTRCILYSIIMLASCPADKWSKIARGNGFFRLRKWVRQEQISGFCDGWRLWRDFIRQRPSTAGMMACPQTAQIGLIGFFLAGFDWNAVWFIDVRRSNSFFGWNQTRKCGSAPVGGQVDALFRVLMILKL